jgi:Fic family protein
MLKPSDCDKQTQPGPNELARWSELRARFQAHITSLVSDPAAAAFFDLSKVYPDTQDILVLLEQLDDLKKCLDSFRPLNPAQIKNLQEAWDVEYTYESNRIEGNTLTLQETSLVINEGITIGGKRLNEHLEAINHKDAIAYIRELASGQMKLNEYTLNSIHALILKGIDQGNAGKYRSVPVTISGAKHVPPQPFLILTLMEDLFRFHDIEKDRMHPVLLAAEMHVRLVTIHPWIDGNGRTSRLLMNLILLQYGYPIANIAADQRITYYNALEKAQVGHDKTDFHRLVAETEKRSLFKYLQMVSGNVGEDARGKGFYFYERIKDYL